MPKRKRQPEAALTRPVRRRPSTRLDAERRNQVLLVVLAAGVVIAALGIALFGYYQTNIAPKGEPVLQVEDRSFSLGYFERRARYEVRNGNTTLLASPENSPDRLIDLVQQEELIRRGAREKGIILTEEDIDREIGRRRNVLPETDREAFAAAYRQAVRESGLATSDFRDLVAADLLESRLKQKFQDELPPTAEQVRYRMIEVATHEEAQAVLDRLNAGEDFAALAAEVSTDVSSKDKGGERPWAARGTQDQALEEVLFSLEPGQRSGITDTGAGAVIVEVLERQADREVTAEQRLELADQAFEQWLEDLRARTRILVLLDEDQTRSILEALADEAGFGT